MNQQLKKAFGGIAFQVLFCILFSCSAISNRFARVGKERGDLVEMEKKEDSGRD